jgi:hypothetical protein
MSQLLYLEKIQKDIEYSVNCQEEMLRAMQRIAEATERTAELLEVLMVDDMLITETKYAKVANRERIQK